RTSEHTYEHGLPHRVKKVEMTKECDYMAVSHYEQFVHDMNQRAKLRGAARNRRKRDTSIDLYYVELLFILDHTIFELGYYSLWAHRELHPREGWFISPTLVTVQTIDLAYQSIDSNVWGISISPFLTEFHIAKSRAESSWTAMSILSTGTTFKTTVIDGRDVLKKMSRWKTEDGRSWKNPDHVMLWTRYDLYDSYLSAFRLANSNAICRGRGEGVSAIEDQGLNSWQVAASQLGHSLGGRNDGTQNNCSIADVHVM
ncbi:hypothetical protein LSAT2_027881, partial [Lamellibrachia satsuma]